MRLAIWAALAVALVGCGNESFGGSRLGESCRASNDCEEDLWCINDRCARADFNVSPSARSCVTIECTTQAECCTNVEMPAECEDLQRLCEEGSDFYCNEYEANCSCRFDCQQNLCVSLCTRDDHCGFGATCAGGRCVECSRDADCFGDAICRQGDCVDACTSNSECPYLHQCQAGQCVESGCSTDRECKALLDDPLAFCADTVCTSPCTNDADCNRGGSYDFNECEGGVCVYVGCETDEECRIALGLGPGSDVTAVCQ